MTTTKPSFFAELQRRNVYKVGGESLLLRIQQVSRYADHRPVPGLSPAIHRITHKI